MSTVEFPPAAQQYVEALIRDADQLIGDIENLIGRRAHLWGSLSVLNGWDVEDINGDNFEASTAGFEKLREQSRLDDVDLLLEIAAGRLIEAVPAYRGAVQRVTLESAFRQRRAIRGSLADEPAAERGIRPQSSRGVRVQVKAD